MANAAPWVRNRSGARYSRPWDALSLLPRRRLRCCWLPMESRAGLPAHPGSPGRAGRVEGPARRAPQARQGLRAQLAPQATPAQQDLRAQLARRDLRARRDRPGPQATPAQQDRRAQLARRDLRARQDLPDQLAQREPPARRAQQDPRALPAQPGPLVKPAQAKHRFGRQPRRLYTSLCLALRQRRRNGSIARRRARLAAFAITAPLLIDDDADQNHPAHHREVK